MKKTTELAAEAIEHASSTIRVDERRKASAPRNSRRRPVFTTRVKYRKKADV